MITTAQGGSGGQPQDQRNVLARLIAMLRGLGGPSGAFPAGAGGMPQSPMDAFPTAPAAAPGEAPTDMSVAGPWGAGFPPVPTPTPRPEPTVQPVRRLNRGQY